MTESYEVISFFTVIITYVLSFGVSIVTYCLFAAGCYRMAKNRGITPAFFAWIPFLQEYTFGSIADAANLKNRGKRTSMRIILPLLQVVPLVVVFVMFGVLFAILFQLEATEYYDVEAPLAMLLSLLPLFLILFVAAILSAVFRYIALYRIYNDYEPDNAVLFLVLSLFFSIAQPILIFALRNKQPRMVQQYAPGWNGQPPYINYQ